jgi:hypothetical protein
LGLAVGAGAGEQAQVMTLAPAGARQFVEEATRGLQVADPEQAAETPAIHHQGEGLIELFRLRRQPLQGEPVGDPIGRMAPMAELVEAAALRWPKSGGSAGYHPLFHGV